MDISSHSGKEAFQAYQRIDPCAYRERVRFYDEHTDAFQGLGYEQQMYLQLDYHYALFEIGKYRRFLVSVDELIEQVVIDNFGGFHSDYFQDLLFKKAASLYNLWRLPECEKVVTQLLKIDGSIEGARAILYQCRLRSARKWYKLTKATSVLCFLTGAVGLLVAHLVIEPFYFEWFPAASFLSTGLLASCVILLVCNEVLLRLSARRDVARI